MTPRTDERIIQMLSDLQSGTMDVVPAELARELEQELAETLESLVQLREERNELNNVLRAAGWGQGEIDSAWETVQRARVEEVEECAKLVEAMGEALRLVDAPISAEAAGGFAAAIRALKEKKP